MHWLICIRQYANLNIMLHMSSLVQSSLDKIRPYPWKQLFYMNFLSLSSTCHACSRSSPLELQTPQHYSLEPSWLKMFACPGWLRRRSSHVGPQPDRQVLFAQPAHQTVMSPSDHRASTSQRDRQAPRPCRFLGSLPPAGAHVSAGSPRWDAGWCP